MTKFLKLLVFTSIMSGSILAQSNKDTEKDNFAPNIIFVEAGGNGLLISINYERLITKNAGIRAGAGTAFAFGTTFPLMLNCYLGGTNKLEFGAGVNYIAQISNGHSESIKEGFLIIGTIGLRHQKPSGGIVIRIGLTPFLNPADATIILWGGISIGYAFQ